MSATDNFVDDIFDKTYLFYISFWEKVFQLFYNISDKSLHRCCDILKKVENLLSFVKDNFVILSSPVIAIILDVIIQVLY